MKRDDVVTEIARKLAAKPLPEELRRLVSNHQKITALDAAQLAWGAAALAVLAMPKDDGPEVDFGKEPIVKAFLAAHDHVTDQAKSDDAWAGSALDLYARTTGIGVVLRRKGHGYLDQLVPWHDLRERPAADVLIEAVNTLHFALMASEAAATEAGR